MKVSLTPPLEAIVQDKIKSGFYNNANDVIREALRLMHERDQRDCAKLERLRKEAALGFDALDRGELSKRTISEIFDDVLVKHQTKK